MSSSPSTDVPSRECDFAAFVARVCGDVVLARQMAAIFLADADRLLIAVRDAVAAGVPDDVRSAAHALKGAASNFNAGAVVRAAAALEAMGKAGELRDADATLRTLEREFQTMIQLLRTAIEDGTPCAS